MYVQRKPGINIISSNIYSYLDIYNIISQILLSSSRNVNSDLFMIGFSNRFHKQILLILELCLKFEFTRMKAGKTSSNLATISL